MAATNKRVEKAVFNYLNKNAIKELACAVIKKAKKDCDYEFFESQDDSGFWAVLAYGKMDFKGFESVARQCREDREKKLLKEAERLKEKQYE